MKIWLARHQRTHARIGPQITTQAGKEITPRYDDSIHYVNTTPMVRLPRARFTLHDTTDTKENNRLFIHRERGRKERYRKWREIDSIKHLQKRMKSPKWRRTIAWSPLQWVWHDVKLLQRTARVGNSVKVSHLHRMKRLHRRFNTIIVDGWVQTVATLPCHESTKRRQSRNPTGQRLQEPPMS